MPRLIAHVHMTSSPPDAAGGEKLRRIVFDQSPLPCVEGWWRTREATRLGAALDASEVAGEPVRSLNGKVYDLLTDAGGVWKRNAVDEGRQHPVLNELDEWTGQVLTADGISTNSSSPATPAYTNAEALLLVHGFILPSGGECQMHTLIWQPPEWWTPPQTTAEEELRVERMSSLLPASACSIRGPGRCGCASPRVSSAVSCSTPWTCPSSCRLKCTPL